PGDFFKLLYVGISNLDISNSLILSYKLFDGLLTVGNDRRIRLFCFCSFFSLRWAMYLVTAALSSLPVNFVPLTTSVKVLFSTSSCMGHRLLSMFFCRGGTLALRRDHQPP